MSGQDGGQLGLEFLGKLFLSNITKNDDKNQLPAKDVQSFQSHQRFKQF
jgi:hypothetical protein